MKEREGRSSGKGKGMKRKGGGEERKKEKGRRGWREKEKE